MDILLFSCSHASGIPLCLHLRCSRSRGSCFSGNFFPPSARERLFRLARCRASLSSRWDDQIAPVDSGAVDVIAIGSRKEALIDFCLDSPFLASSGLRLWTIHESDSSTIKLSQRCTGKDTLQRTLEFPLSLQSCPSATILVASAGVDRDHVAAIMLLNAVKLAGGLAIAVLLRPFNFEGQRRQLEVDDLLKKLQDSSIFYSVVETDALLKKEVETLADALKSSHNAVLLTICTISALTSEVNQKLLVAPNDQVMELDASEVAKLVKSFGELRAGFGTGYDIKSSIKQAALHCSFLGGSLKGINGTVVISLSCAREMKRRELSAIAPVFRQITGFLGEIIFCGVHEPSLEPNLVITTLFILRFNEASFLPKQSFLSSLASHFPFFSSLIPKEHLSHHLDSSASHASSTSCNSDHDVIRQERHGESSLKVSGDEITEGIESISAVCHETDEEEQLSSPSVGPGFDMAQHWARERAALSGRMGTSRNSKANDFPVLVGVKSSEMAHLVSQSSSPMDVAMLDDLSREPSTLTKAKDIEVPRRRGALSARAESMLETERESEKMWTPVIQLQYRGGTYKGRHQGGLPEGKGRLTLEDGSFYEGMWRSGRRCGPGTFCYSNGDVFQGSWRDDVMHGKGWFYFHTGDRWFANFWRGKANGEGRFYSCSGSVFFGAFRDGWRHGPALFIDSHGFRWAERWEDGVLEERVRVE